MKFFGKTIVVMMSLFFILPLAQADASLKDLLKTVFNQ
jgi:hypothetical protein